MRKRYFLILFFITIATISSFAQYLYKPFRVDIGAGYSHSITNTKEHIGHGLVLSLEPKYSIYSNISIGFRVELNVFQSSVKYLYRDDYYEYEPNMGVPGSSSSSYLLTGDYYFTSGKFRPFIGLGLGLSHLPGHNYNSFIETHYIERYEVNGPNPYPDEMNQIPNKIHFASMIRGGFEHKHFRFTIEYNYGGNNRNIGFNYACAKISIYLGGGELSLIQK